MSSLPRPSERPTTAGSWPVRQRVARTLRAFLRGDADACPVSDSRQRGLGSGSVELEVLLAVVADLEVARCIDGATRASFVLEGHLPATQLCNEGVTIVPLEALRLSDVAISDDVAERLEAWHASGAAITGELHFERQVVDRYRGRGPLRSLSLADEHGERIVLRRG